MKTRVPQAAGVNKQQVADFFPPSHTKLHEASLNSVLITLGSLSQTLSEPKHFSHEAMYLL